MTEANRSKQPAGGRGKSSNKGTSPKRATPEYTPRQRERMQKGLRILAKVIVRAHLRKQAESSGSD